jgi:hypothetical protein
MGALESSGEIVVPLMRVDGQSIAGARRLIGDLAIGPIDLELDRVTVYPVYSV